MRTAQEILMSHNKFRINLGLKRIKLILALLNNPQNTYKVIQIAGTNGKGSTCKIINDILVEHSKNSSIKVGLYTSPHLFSYTERIKINNKDIKEDVFNRLLNDINNLALKSNLDLTEFELLTAVALYYFYINKVDYVILEVGMGGKYDATNVIKTPLLGIITTIDLDHTNILGNTINKIALQKAGIIKENSKVIVSDKNLGFDVIKKVAQIKDANIIIPKKIDTIFKNKKNYVILNNEEIEFKLFGKHQENNLCLALCAIDNLDIKIEKKEIINALKNVSWKFRLEYNEDKNILIDGAHNPSGTKVLRSFLDENFKDEEKIFIFGCLNTKDVKSMLDSLIKNEKDSLYYLEFKYKNALKFEELPIKYQNISTKINSLKEIENIINDKKKLKVFCGSLYMLGNIFKDL